MKMGAFILVILITMGSGEDLKSFEIRMNVTVRAFRPTARRMALLR